MKAGKININELKSLVLDKIENDRSEVLVGPKIGEDSAILECKERVIVISTDPITGAEKEKGELIVNISCNDIAACGAYPIGIEETFLFPPDTDKRQIIELTESINQAADKLGIDILGGHTEVTEIVNKPLVSSTAIGTVSCERYVTSSGAEPGDKIVITKWAGLEGTSILAFHFSDFLLESGIKRDVLKQAKNLSDFISVIPEGRKASEFGVSAMHDVTEGGLYGCLFELAEASKVGFEIQQEKVPLHPATLELAKVLSFNPYCLIGSGMMILTSDKAEKLVDVLENSEIKATIIGSITSRERVIRRKDEDIFLSSPPEDELWRLLDSGISEN